jgi:membrane protein DedA with SNARE-associated domain
VRVAAVQRSALLLLFAPALFHVHHLSAQAAVHVSVHHRFHGPPFDYAGLALAAAASWIGLPGPGEPVLIAAGLLAAHHRLDIASVILVAFLAAAGGGIVGWLIGLKAGRRILSAPGPLHTLRLRALERGDEVFERYVAIAVFVAPTWVAGIHRVRPAVYLPLNFLWALVWAAGIGLGAYFAGPPIEDLASDLGWVVTVGLVLLVLAGVWFEVRRRLRRRSRQAAEPLAAAASAAQQPQHEQEHVEDVQEDAGGDRDRTGHVGAAQAVEVEDRERPEHH